MPVTDPSYATNALVGTRKQYDYLEVSFKPTSGTAVTWERIPLVSDLGAYAAETSDSELPLFVDANGQSETLRASQANGGRIPFSTAAHASNATFKKLIAAAAASTPVVYRAHYASMGVMIQGRATIADRGMQGGATDIPTWSFELLASTAQYVDRTTNEAIV